MSRPLRFAVTTLAPLWLAACASAPTPPAVPDALVPPGERVVERLAAKGVQVYQCRVRGHGTGNEWGFVAPEAELFDAQGRAAGKHYAGPTWEAADGSKIVGSVKTRADAPVAGAIPWLLLGTRSTAGDGRFAKVTHVQRINTVGGVAPATPCDAASLGSTQRIPYTADYVLLAP